MIAEVIGTLVLTIATANGLIVASDSRYLADGEICDRQAKILEPASPPRTIVAVTGHGIVLAAPEDVTEIRHVCDSIKTAPRLLDIGATVVRYLEARGSDLAKLDMRGLAKECLAAVRAYAMLRPNALRRYAGRDMFVVVLASYAPKSRLAHIRALRVSVSARGEPFVSERIRHDIDRNESGFGVFGEVKYLTENVFRGAGRKFLSKEAEKLVLERPPARRISTEQAKAAAENIVEAASKTTALVPLKGSAIGGPVDVLLLGAAPKPQRLR